MIRWFAKNSIAANFLMLAILVAGTYTAVNHVPLEVTPALSWDTVMIDMPYRGGTAKDIERAILIPIEEALEGVEGIEHLHADGMRGRARIYVNGTRETDLRSLMDDAKARVDTIETFPDETERPRIYIPESANVYELLKIAVTGRMSQHDMREVSRRVQQDLLEMPGISRVEIRGARDYEISVEADTDRLLAYDLTFQDLAESIRRFSIDLPAGAIESDSGTFIIRTSGQAWSQEEFAVIPLRSSGGAQVLLGEVTTIRDGFVEGERRLEFNGKPALFVEVMRVGNENALKISQQVHKYVHTAGTRFPDGIELTLWDDL